MGALDDALATVERIKQETDVRTIEGELLAVSRRFGFKAVGIAIVRSDALVPVFNTGWPENWYGRYVEQHYERVDPIIRRVRNSVRPFLWRDVYPDAAARKRVRALFDDSKQIGLPDGLAIPVHLPASWAGFINFASDRVEIEETTKDLLHLVSLYALGRIVELNPGDYGMAPAAGAAGGGRRERLTPREIECLRWAADGKTSWEIAQILEISQHTADWYLTSAARKLKVVNRIQAVAEAFRRGIIS